MDAKRSRLLALTLLVMPMMSCDRTPERVSKQASDWEAPAGEDGLRTYVIDWACEPKQWGSAAEKKAAYQDEYCEWRVEKTTGSEKVCRFTTSFDGKRDFYLNSRGQTPFNSISAARILVEDCNDIAMQRLNANKTPGNLCSGITAGCKSGRNSDPEICDKVRWATGEKYAKHIDFCVDQLAPRDSIKTPRPLIQFGILTELPENCVYATDDHTEVNCTIPAEDDCFSVAGQLRPGMRVVTKSLTSGNGQLPKGQECFTP